MKRIALLILFATLSLAGCQSVLLTVLAMTKGTDVPPKYDILSKGEIRVAVVPRSIYADAYELQNAPREIGRIVRALLDERVQNKKLKVVEQSKVEVWLDNCNHDFDSFLEVGRDKSIDADIVIGIDIIAFQIRDSKNPHLIQGKCEVAVEAIDCATGKTLATESLTVIDPPNVPLSGNTSLLETQFRPRFLRIVAERISSLFHHYDPNKLLRIDADNIDMY